MEKQNLDQVPDEIVDEAEQAKVANALGIEEKPDEKESDSKKTDTPSSEKTPDENGKKTEKEKLSLDDNLKLARYKQQVEGSKQEAMKEKERAEALEKENKALREKKDDGSSNQEEDDSEVEQKFQPLEQRISSLEKEANAKKETEVNNIISTFRKDYDISDDVYEVVIKPQLPAIKEMIDPATGKPYPLEKGLEIALLIGNREKLVTDAQAETLAKVKAQKGATKQSGAKSTQSKQKEEYSDDQQYAAEQMGTKLD